jgi:hypothetical protein
MKRNVSLFRFDGIGKCGEEKMFCRPSEGWGSSRGTEVGTGKGKWVANLVDPASRNTRRIRCSHVNSWILITTGYAVP